MFTSRASMINLMALTKWLSISALLGCQSIDKTITNGPFTIERVIKKESNGSWYNNGTSPFATDKAIYYQIRYKDKKITLRNGDSDDKLFYKALSLNHSGKPAILAGSAAMYLLTEENGQLKSELLSYNKDESGSYQWLDSENNQPGYSYKAYSQPAAEDNGYLEGGKFLLINNNCVLDVVTHRFYPFEKNSYEAHQKSGDFFSEHEIAAGFSPNRTQVVFVGYKRKSDNHLKHIYGLILVDFIHQTLTALPFDQNQTRFIPEYCKHPEWLHKHFEWVVDENGREKLIARKSENDYWKGYFSGDLPGTAAEDDYYSLQPVKSSIVETLKDYLIKKWDASLIESRKFEDSATLIFKIGKAEITLFDNIRQEKKISLSTSLASNTAENRALVRQIGKDLNAQLASGQFREYFDVFD